MKYLLFMALIALSPLYAAAWSPSASLGIFWEGNIHKDGIDSTKNTMTSIAAAVEASLPAITIGPHRFSLPFHIIYTSQSIAIERIQRLSSLEAGAGFEYSYRIRRIEIGSALTAAIRWYEKANAAEWIIGGKVHASFRILPYASVTIPLWISGGKSGISIRTGAAITLQFGGII